MPQVQVGPRRIDAELHTKRATELELSLELFVGDDVGGPGEQPFEVGHGAMLSAGHGHTEPRPARDEPASPDVKTPGLLDGHVDPDARSRHDVVVPNWPATLDHKLTARDEIGPVVRSRDAE